MEWPARLPLEGGGGVSHVLVHVHNPDYDRDHDHNRGLDFVHYKGDMLPHSLQGMEPNQLDEPHDFSSKAHCFVRPQEDMKSIQNIS